MLMILPAQWIWLIFNRLREICIIGLCESFYFKHLITLFCFHTVSSKALDDLMVVMVVLELEQTRSQVSMTDFTRRTLDWLVSLSKWYMPHKRKVNHYLFLLQTAVLSGISEFMKLEYHQAWHLPARFHYHSVVRCHENCFWKRCITYLLSCHFVFLQRCTMPMYYLRECLFYVAIFLTVHGACRALTGNSD